MLLQCSFKSPVLRRNTDINVILPTPREEDETLVTGYPVLYLLHGMHGDYNSWLYKSNILRYAEEHNLAVVMPSVSNSFYQDMVHGERFFTYVTEELPHFVKELFPVSRKREDTFVAGLSMGGYGAYLLALSRPEQYGAAASLSGALDIGFRVTPVVLSDKAPKPFFVEDCFGDAGKIAGSDSDIFTLFEKAKEKGTLPRLYQACGTADYLYGMNRLSYQKLTEMGAEISYHETEGMIHDWNFWEMEIPKVLKWLMEKEA